MGRDGRQAGRRHRDRRARSQRLSVPAQLRHLRGPLVGLRRWDFEDGNNQESSSEAVNAWAGARSCGARPPATGALRDLGIYLYTSEVAAIAATGSTSTSRYWQRTSASRSRAWCSAASIAYNTWWTQEPRQISASTCCRSRPPRPISVRTLPTSGRARLAAAGREALRRPWQGQRNARATSGRTCSPRTRRSLIPRPH